MAVLNQPRGYEVYLLDGLLERVPAHVTARYNTKMDTAHVECLGGVERKVSERA